jgi:1-aminocyclopropane-1-carboxylate deaminase/D-cysteine desulfhydrase-like pyridoxal-dependent ACC family enzyme
MHRSLLESLSFARYYTSNGKRQAKKNFTVSGNKAEKLKYIIKTEIHNYSLIRRKKENMKQKRSTKIFAKKLSLNLPFALPGNVKLKLPIFHPLIDGLEPNHV